MASFSVMRPCQAAVTAEENSNTHKPHANFVRFIIIPLELFIILNLRLARRQTTPFELDTDTTYALHPGFAPGSLSYIKELCDLPPPGKARLPPPSHY